MNIKLLVLLFISPLLYAQIDLETSVFKLNEYNDQLTIKQAITKEAEGYFNEPLNLETYRFIKGKEANWICINVPKQKEKQYLSIENSMFEELRFYVYKDTKISIPEDLRDENQYRFPIIALNTEQTPCKIFIRSKDALSFRTEFIIKNYNQESLNSTIQRDYFVIGAFLISMLVLLISTCVFFMYKKEYAILWFGLHLALMSIEYLISTGTFSQWFIANDIILKWGLDHVSLLLSSAALLEFYRRFYPYNSKTIFCKKIFTLLAFLCLGGALFSIIDGFSGNIFNVEWYAQNTLNIAALTSLVIYIILTYYKVIPIYLFIAFLLPVLGIFANTGGLKEQFDNPHITYILFQSVYFAILIETMVIIFYIMKKSVDGELKAVELADENNKLKFSFQEDLSANQEQHQNALLSDVHDSFGGYIEALKLTLINKKIQVSAVDDILSSFTKDYRLLLNSLYVPNVNTENFIGAIREYCDKMDKLSEIDISFNYNNDKYIEIPQNIAKFIFKASSELTTNAIKYANPTYINVSLTLNPSYIILDVADNGIGFSVEKIKNSSYGLNGIKKRVTNFNGEINIQSVPNKPNKRSGSQINIKIPIPESID